MFAYRKARQEAAGFFPFVLLHGKTVRGPAQILKVLWSKEEGVKEFTTSYQYVLEQLKRFDKAMKLVQVEMDKQEIV